MIRKRPKRVHLDLNLLGVGSLGTLHGILEREIAEGGHENDKKGLAELILNKYAVEMVCKEKRRTES